MNLTDMEKDVIRAIAENEYCDVLGQDVWSWAISHQTKITNDNQIPGVVSSLVKKGLVVSSQYDYDRVVKLTQKGIKEYKNITL